MSVTCKRCGDVLNDDPAIDARGCCSDCLMPGDGNALLQWIDAGNDPEAFEVTVQ